MDDGRAIALVDWDHDGDLDLWTTNRNAPRIRFLRNDFSSESPHFVMLRLKATDGRINRDAIGARVEVVTQEKLRRVKTLRAGDGFLAQSSKWLHFGLGKVDQIEKVMVTWPGGKTEQFTDVKADHRCYLVQGEGRAACERENGRELVLQPGEVRTSPPTSNAKIPLTTLIPMPPQGYLTLDHSKAMLKLGDGMPTLLNLWSSSCVPCLEELDEISERQAELRNARVDVVALCVDRLADKQSDAEDVLARLKFPFTSGHATSQLVHKLQLLDDYLTVKTQPIPVPSSFLFDEQGRLSVIYKGRVSVDDLLRDVGHAGGSRSERFQRSACVAGRAIDHPQVIRTAERAEWFLRLHVGGAFHIAGWYDEAAANYAAAVASNPASAVARFNHANVLNRLGRWDEAANEYLAALKHRPDFFQAHYNAGAVFAKLHQWNKAKEHFEHAIRLDQSRVEPHVDLGMVFFELNEPELSVASLKQAIAIDGDYAEAHNGLGMVYFKQNNLKGAANCFRRAIQLRPDDVKTQFRLGLVFLNQGERNQAAEQFHHAVKAKPDDAEFRFHLGVARLQLGDHHAAIEQFERALKIRPDDAETHNNLGIAYGSLRNNTMAAENFQRAIRLRPNFAEAHCNLGYVLVDKGRLALALTHFERALALQPDFAAAKEGRQKVLARLDPQ